MNARLVATAVFIVLWGTRVCADGGTPSPNGEPQRLQAYNWTGFYVGDFLGDAWGRSDWSAQQTSVAGPTLTGSLAFFQPYDAF
jgi:hypothetical protein